MSAGAGRTRLISVSLLVVLLGGGFGGPGHTAEGATAPQTLTVDENGTYGFRTIQSAIDAANPGDTIRVLEGYYEENVVVDKSLSVIGDGMNETRIDARLAGDGIRVTSDDTLISGVKVINAVGDYFPTGIRIEDCQDILVENCWTLNCDIGILIINSTGVVIRNTTVDEWHDCILMVNTTHSSLLDNRISTRSGIAILINLSSNVEIINNTCDAKWGDGIYLRDSDNNIIEHNLLLPYYLAKNLTHPEYTGNMVGMKLESSSNNFISHNDFRPGLSTGITLEYASANTISNNTFKDLEYGGIGVYSSGNCSVEDNILTNCSTGLYADLAPGLTCTGNIMTDSGIELNGDEIDVARSQVIDDTNTVNGRPVYHLIDGADMEAPVDVGQMILINCTNVTVEGYSCNNTSTGIQVHQSEGCRIINNTCTNNSYAGIRATHCRNLTVEGNNASGNYIGIEMWATGDEKMLWNSNRILRNICRDNQYGIRLENSVNDGVFSNTCDHNNVGMYARKVTYASIGNNSFSYNKGGFVSEGIDNSNLWANTCYGNTGTGIRLQKDCEYVYVDENNCSENNIGIYNTKGIAIHVQKNDIEHNGVGVEVSESSLSTIQRNSLKSNVIGAQFEECFSPDDHSRGVHFNDNTVEENSWGVYLIRSTYMELHDNMIARNNDTGILIHHSGSTDNLIYHNNIIDNNIQAMDMGENTWASPRGEGGNYWSDYEGADNGSWPKTAGDNIGDTNIPHHDVDFFPYLNESGWDYPCIPELYGPEPDGDGDYDLWWSTGRANEYVVEEDDDINFTSPVEVYRGWNLSCNVSGRPEGEHYYRIKAGNREMETNWSGPLVVIVDHSLRKDDDGGDDGGDTTDVNSLAWAIAILAIIIVIVFQYRIYLRARVEKYETKEGGEDDEGRENVVEKQEDTGDKGK